MILFIDCYDSFSYNLTRLIESACPEQEVAVVHNDEIKAGELESFLPFLDAIVIGPGPGDPQNIEDSGIIQRLWGLVLANPVPVFGVCFGYQSMVLAFGGKVERMHPPQHGRIGQIERSRDSAIFSGIPAKFHAVRYHSLHARAHSPLICTAIDRETTPDAPVEMAAEHEFLPFYGVQFHPESVLSNHGKSMFNNFWSSASNYNQKHRIIGRGTIPSTIKVSQRPLLRRTEAPVNPDLVVKKVPRVPWKQVISLLQDVVITKSAAAPGEWSIFGLVESGITPHIRSKNGTVHEGPLHSPPQHSVASVPFWEYAAEFMKKRIINATFAAEINKYALPFLGGLTGYVSYEGGCQYTLKGGTHCDSGLNSDFSLVYITKCVLLNEKSGELFAVGPSNWVTYMEARINELKDRENEVVSPLEIRTINVTKMPFNEYEQLYNNCYEKLQSGDSYELCLTSQAQLRFEASTDPLKIFLQLVDRNPAPYCSFMNFDDTLISTSPERFMSWDAKSCEFRPIKGTVRKRPGMTRELAEEILRTPKEQAENLMIVDLIRHDLNQMLDDVTTPQLMAVEEYHSVYQLVTSVRGRFPQGRVDGPSGVDLLSRSLPPGSMTGAPKKRSVEILRSLETQPRGIYSGVHGYWSIDDRGDWSVVIRSLFKSKHDDPGLWRLGAGGAITILSTAAQEYDEMMTKMDSVLNAFN